MVPRIVCKGIWPKIEIAIIPRPGIEKVLPIALTSLFKTVSRSGGVAVARGHDDLMVAIRSIVPIDPEFTCAGMLGITETSTIGYPN